MNNKNISDKIDMFFKVIDTNWNGLLSYDEVFVIRILMEYFANLICQFVNKPTHEEIPLEMFIYADGFT